MPRLTCDVRLGSLAHCTLMLVVLCLAVWPVRSHAQGSGPNTPVSTSSTAPTTGSTEALLVELLGRDTTRNYAMPSTIDPASPIAAVYGNLADPSSDHGQACWRFIEHYGRILGFPPDEAMWRTMSIYRYDIEDYGRMLTYLPVTGGVPFLKARVTFSFDASDRLVAVVGRYKPAQNVDMGSTTPAQALQIARSKIEEAYPGQTISGDGLVQEFIDEILEPPPFKVFHVLLTTGQPPEPKRVVIFGSTAMAPESGRHFVDGKVAPQDVDSGTSTQTLDNIDYPGFWGSYTMDGFWFRADSAHGDRASSFFGSFDEDVRLNYGTRPSPKFLEVNIYHHLTQARKKALAWGGHDINLYSDMPYDHWLPPEPQRDDDGNIVTDRRGNTVYRFGTFNNAAFDSVNWKFIFARHNPITENRRHGGEEASVIHHEFAHFLHNAINSEFMLGVREEMREAQAVTEGFADLFAAASLGNPRLSTYFVPIMVRDVSPVKKYSEVTPCWAQDGEVPGNPRAKEVHEAGLCFASAGWRLRPILGEDLTMKIVVAAMRQAGAPSTFRATARALLAAEQQLGAGAKARDILTVLVDQELAFPARWAAGAH